MIRPAVYTERARAARRDEIGGLDADAVTRVYAGYEAAKDDST